MKKLVGILSVCLVSALAYAGHLAQETFIFDYSGTGVVGKITLTNITINGHIEEIVTDSPEVGVTSTVAVVVQPSISTMSTYNLMASQTVSGDTTIRPRYVPTDTTGALISSNALQRFGVNNPVIVTWTNTGTVTTGFYGRLQIIYEPN